MDRQINLFDNIKYCDICHRPLPFDYEEDLCPACIQEELFSKVRDYIRENDVNEYDVSEHFNLPLRQIKQWIREGRIEYKTDQPLTLTQMHCLSCGAPIAFGSYCQTCYKLMNVPKATYVKNTGSDNRMRFLESDE